MTTARKKTPMYRPVKGKFGMQAFPKQLFNTIRYVDVVSIPQVTGSGRWQFSCNGCYDPNITGTGTQPMYFDQLAAIYNHYTVLKSKAKFTFYSNSNTPVCYTVYIDDDTTTQNNAYLAAQFDTAVTRYAVTSTGSEVVMYSTWDAKKSFGGAPQSDPELQGNSGANPVEQQYYTMIVLDTNATTGNNVTCLVEIDYSCVWDEYVTTTPS